MAWLSQPIQADAPEHTQWESSAMRFRVSGMEVGKGVGGGVRFRVSCLPFDVLCVVYPCFGYELQVSGFRVFEIFGFSGFRGWGVTSSDTVRPWVGKKSGFVITRAQMVLVDD